MSEYKMPLRSEVKQSDKWDLVPIFANDTAWEEEFTAVVAFTEKAESFRDKLTNSSEILLSALKYRDELYNRMNKLYVYAHLNEDTDTADSHYQSLSARAISLMTEAQSSFSYFKAELAEADENKLWGYLDESPELSVYAQEFKVFYDNKPYILSQKEEKIIAKSYELLDNPTKTFSILNNADLIFPEVEDENGQKIQLSHGLYSTMLEKKNKNVRKSAYQGFYKPYDELKNTFSTTLSGAIKSHNFIADVRGYDSARHASLMDNSIPESVYDALVDAVNEGLPLLHRYVDLRQKALKVDEVNMYDMYVPIVDDVDMSFTFDEAKELVIEGLAALGKEYQSILRKAFDENWIDHVENKGKRSGAYSSGTYGTNPYILMNWQGNLDNVFTLAHELGHSVHSYYTRSSQPFIYGNYSIFLAEIASTTNENLLTEYLLNKYDDPKIKAYIINHFLDGMKGTVYRQTQFAEFEHLIHKLDKDGTPLTTDVLSQLYGEINKKYYGPKVGYDNEISLEWARIPHFYYDYYVYQYATGFSAASAFSKKILSEGQPALNAYIEFLKAGCSDYPIEVLKKAGIDMNTNKPVHDALSVFEQRLTELEQIL